MTALPGIPLFTVQAALSNGPLDSTIVWTDIGSAMAGFSTTGGRQHWLGRTEPTQLTMRLNNRDGRFTPGNTNSPYYNLLSTPDSLGLLGSWVTSAGSIAAQTTQTVYGPSAGQITTGSGVGTTISTATGSVGAAVTPGVMYGATAQMRAASTTASTLISVLFYTASGTFISATAASGATDSASAWTTITSSGVAPPLAAFAAVQITIGNLGAHVHYFTCIGLLAGTSTPGWTLGQTLPLIPGKPVRVVGNYSGSAFPAFYGFADKWDPGIIDALNQECTLTATDVLKLLGLAPLSNSLLYPATVNALSPGAYYRLGDSPGSTTAADLSGHSHTATAQNAGFGNQDATGAAAAALLTSGFTGGGSGAIIYDPANCVKLADNGGLAPQITTPAIFGSNTAWTFVALIQGSQSGDAFVLEVLNSGIAHVIVSIDGVTGQLAFSTTGFVAGAEGGPALDDGLWHMVAITFPAGSGTISVTIDNVAAFTTTTTGATAPTTSAILGQGTTTSSVSTVLNMQDVAFFPSVLNSTQLTSLFSAYHLLQDAEFPGARIQKVLTIIGYGSYPANIAAGTQLLQGETTSQTQVASLGYIQTVTDTELGFFYQGDDGFLNFRDQSWPTSNPTSNTSQATFGDNASASCHYIGPSLKIPQDDLDYWNDIQVQAQQAIGAGVMQEVINQAAIGPPGGSGRRTLQRTGLLFFSDAETKAQAELLLRRYSTPIKRVQSMEVGAEVGAANIIQMLLRALWDQITVQRAGSNESAFSQPCLIESKNHTYESDPGKYHVTFATSPYELIT